MRTKGAVLAWLMALLTLSTLWPGSVAAQTGTTYTVQAGDSLGYIASTYGTSIDAIMQANGLASPDMIWVGQDLVIPVQSTAGNAGSGGNSYTVQVGDTLASIAGQLGVSAAALAGANGLTNPDFLWVGQRLLIPGTTLGSPAAAPPPQPDASGSGYYTVQAGDTLNSIARQFGTSAAALAQSNNLANSDLLVLGQRLLLPAASAPAATPAPQNPAPVTGGAGRYVVQPGDTVNSIAQAFNVSPDALVRANDLADADVLVTGQALVIPGAAASAPGATPVPPTVAPPTAAPPTVAPPASATPLPPAAAPAASAGSYVVKPGDTLNSIAAAVGVSAGDLASANGLANADMLAVGQVLAIPGGAGSPAPTPALATAVPAPAAAGQGASEPVPARYTVKRGDTLGSIAQKYGVSAAAIARANQISSPDLVAVGMTLLIPPQPWTASDLTGRPSRFVASISQQRCWLYQGNRVVADWPCSTGQAGTDTHPGSYKIQSKMDRAFGSTWNIWMPYWLGIYWAGASENGIHGIPYSATDNNWRLWEGYVGTPVTYGCVLLDDAHAKQLYDLAYIGMPVIIQP